MSDDGIKAVREVRHQISKECEHDVDRLVSRYQEMEKKLRAAGEFQFVDVRSERHTVSKPKTPASDK